MPHPLRLAPVLALIFVMWAQVPPAAADNVDLALVLAVDVSRSIDDAEYDLQRKGYATALSDPRVVRAITSGEHGRIALCYFEWSGEFSQQLIVDWTVIHDTESAGKFAAQLVEAQRPFANRTSLGVAIEYAIGLLGRSPHRASRQVIDVSGDGTNTNGVEPSTMRDAAVAKGVTINGLVINNPNEMPWIPWHTHPPGGLDNYYRENVAGGPGAFVMQAENFESFSTAIIDKLVREIAHNGQFQDAGTQTAAASAQGREPETKYLIGNVFTAASRPRM